MLPMAMQGQTIRRFESKGWFEALTQGTVIRPFAPERNDYSDPLVWESFDTLKGALKRVSPRYMIFDEGIGNIITFDFVNGYNYGPDLTFGYVDHNYCRWEVSPELRYSDRRHRWSGSLDFRLFLPPEYYSWIALFGRRKCLDFDNDAFASYETNSMASAIAGWNGYKLYDAQQMGLRGSAALGRDFQLEGGAWYEKRWQVENHRQRNIFRVKGEDNLPRVRGMALDDPRHQWRRMSLWRVDATLQYTPNRRIMCFNDLRTEALPGSPVFSLSAQSGWGDIDYLALSLGVKQERVGRRQGFRYMAVAGCYPLGSKEVGVIDMHHLDASHMALQRKDNLTWFSLLSNYELSTSGSWAEAHAEWSSCRMLVTQLTNDPALHEYVQWHFASVEGSRCHSELSYGFDLAGEMRIGCSLGWDGSHFDGVGLNIIFYDAILGK